MDGQEDEMTTGTVAITVELGVTHDRVTFDFTSTALGAAGDTTTRLFNGAIEGCGSMTARAAWKP